jgi:holin-like protein
MRRPARETDETGPEKVAIAVRRPAGPARFVEGLALLLLFQLLGEGIVRVTGLPFPGNVVGMALLLAALGLGIVPLAWVEQAADHLLSVLALLFIPPGVGLVLYVDLLADEWLAIGAVVLVGTMAVLAVTGAVVELTERRRAAADSGEA